MQTNSINAVHHVLESSGICMVVSKLKWSCSLKVNNNNNVPTDVCFPDKSFALKVIPLDEEHSARW